MTLGRGLLLFATCSSLSAQSMQFHAVQTSTGETVQSAVLTDVDGDGRDDLVIVAGTTRRTIRVHLGDASADGRDQFRSPPAHVVPLPRGVSAFAVGDLLPATGREIVLIGGQTVAAVVLTKDGKPEITSLAGGETLWQSPVPDRVMAWQQGIIDADGDGRDEVWVPTLSGYRRLAMRDGQVVVQDFPLVEPLAERPGPDRVDFQLAFGAQDGFGAQVLLNVEHRLPAPQWIDYDGDRDLDLVAFCNTKLLVWIHDDSWLQSGTIDAAVQMSLPELERPFGDPTYSMRMSDLDADGRADLVWTSTHYESGDPTTIVSVHLQRDDLAKRHDRLRFRGVGAVVQLQDLDADGREELLVGALQTDLSDMVGGAASLQARLSIATNGFDGRRPRFNRPLALNHTLELPVSILQPSRSRASMLLPRPGGGWALLLREEATKLSLRPMLKSGNGYELGRPSWNGAIHEDAIVVSVDERAILVLEPEQVLVGSLR